MRRLLAVVGGARRRYSVALLLGGLISIAGCIGSRPVIENVNPTIPGSKFKVIATVAGGDAGPDLRMSASVRETLSDSGWTAIRRAGRWESMASAVNDICAGGDADGVLVVWYDRLELTDCGTQRTAFAIQGSAERDVGLTEMVKRLMRYLRDQPTTGRR